MIESADSRFVSTGLPPHRMAEASLAPQFWPQPRPVPQGVPLDDVTVPVQVRDGRWIVQCPTCMSAQYAAKTDRRFFCGECGNADHGGRWVTVEWPDVVDDIETILESRPAGTRHWLPHETVADLIAENDRHNISVDEQTRFRHT